MSTCSIDPNLLTEIEQFRFKFNNKTAVLVAKIDREKLLIEMESVTEYKDFDELLEELELPFTSPRYVIISFKWQHADRLQFPLCFIYYSPPTKANLNMLYATNSVMLSNKAGISAKILELRDADLFTKEWITSQIKK
eukprot:NODE_59_length_25653_cov_0.289622.p15 type:complete len:138 gc:universal NODE_59_length_25653_cov_0.289622:22386-21973(-)